MVRKTLVKTITIWFDYRGQRLDSTQNMAMTLEDLQLTSRVRRSVIENY